MPPEPKNTFLSCALIQVMSSGSDFTGTEGCAITTSGTVAMRLTWVNPPTES